MPTHNFIRGWPQVPAPVLLGVTLNPGAIALGRRKAKAKGALSWKNYVHRFGSLKGPQSNSAALAESCCAALHCCSMATLLELCQASNPSRPIPVQLPAGGQLRPASSLQAASWLALLR